MGDKELAEEKANGERFKKANIVFAVLVSPLGLRELIWRNNTAYGARVVVNEVIRLRDGHGWIEEAGLRRAEERM